MNWKDKLIKWIGWLVAIGVALIEILEKLILPT